KIRDALVHNLLDNYTTSMRPVENEDESVNVTLSLMVRLVDELNEESQTMTSRFVLYKEWVDTNLKWNPEEHGNIGGLVVDVDQIWTPQISIVNSKVSVIAESSVFQTPVVTSNGSVLWAHEMQVQTSCWINLNFFPYETHFCAIILEPSELMNINQVNER
ncbi:hypothetical protein CAPTEDRAFT_118247, partial [Capitella teleta]